MALCGRALSGEARGKREPASDEGGERRRGRCGRPTSRAAAPDHALLLRLFARLQPGVERATAGASLITLSYFGCFLSSLGELLVYSIVSLFNDHHFFFVYSIVCLCNGCQGLLLYSIVCLFSVFFVEPMPTPGSGDTET